MFPDLLYEQQLASYDLVIPSVQPWSDEKL